MQNDEFYMKRALFLARKGKGKTSPNPAVGAVLVKEERIIGEGFHRGYGLPHAEVEAIENANGPVEGSTLYCTLEPCCHNTPNKKNPSCTSRIIHEKIKRVVAAAADQNPQVNGRGIETLRKAGIEVTTGILADESKKINQDYSRRILTSCPFVHLKIAQSLDGRIATREGESKWITDVKARKEVHRLRSLYDAVLVGIGTVLSDDPSLTVRETKGKQPVRIILDSHLRIPADSKVLRDGGKTIIATYHKTSNVKIEYLRKTNVDFIKVEGGPGGLDLKKILARLGEMKITSVLVEGGGKVFTSFLRQDLCHRLSVFTAPLLIGAGTEAVGDLGVLKLSQALRLQDVSIRTLGNQSVFEGNLPWMHGRAAGEACDQPWMHGRAAGEACDQPFGLEEDKDVYRLG